MQSDSLDIESLSTAWEGLQNSLNKFFCAVDQASKVLKQSEESSEDSIALHSLRQQIEQLELLGRNLPLQISIVAGAQGQVSRSVRTRNRLKHVQAEVSMMPYVQCGLISGHDFFQLETMLSTGFLRTSDLSRDPFLTLLQPWEAQLCASIAEHLIFPGRVAALFVLGARRGFCAGQLAKVVRVLAVEEDAALSAVLRALVDSLQKEDVGVCMAGGRYLDKQALKTNESIDGHAIWIPGELLRTWVETIPEQWEAAVLRWAYSSTYILLSVEEKDTLTDLSSGVYTFEELTTVKRGSESLSLLLGKPKAIKIGDSLYRFIDKRVDDFRPSAWKTLSIRKRQPAAECPLDRGVRRCVLSDGKLIRSYLNVKRSREENSRFRDHEKEAELWRELGGAARFLPRLQSVFSDLSSGHIILDLPPGAEFVRLPMTEDAAYGFFEKICDVLRFFRSRGLFYNRLRVGHFLADEEGIFLSALEEVSATEEEDSLAALFWLVVDLFQPKLDVHRWRIERPDISVIAEIPAGFQPVLYAILSAASLDDYLASVPHYRLPA